MNTNLFNQEWKVIWEIELNSSIFWLELNEWLVHRALVYQLANNRTNISHTKTRWERREERLTALFFATKEPRQALLRPFFVSTFVGFQMFIRICKYAEYRL